MRQSEADKVRHDLETELWMIMDRKIEYSGLGITPLPCKVQAILVQSDILVVRERNEISNDVEWWIDLAIAFSLLQHAAYLVSQHAFFVGGQGGCGARYQCV
jgi:hypothetical protein